MEVEAPKSLSKTKHCLHLLQQCFTEFRKKHKTRYYSNRCLKNTYCVYLDMDMDMGLPVYLNHVSLVLISFQILQVKNW